MSTGRPDPRSALAAPPSPGDAAILVVDEDPAFQLGLKTFLREYVGFEKVHTAESGRAAIDLIESNPAIDVVTLDYRMPGMNGIEVLQRLATTIDRPLSVMMITGYPSDQLETEFRACGGSRLLTTHFVSKPVEFEKLEPLVLRAHEEALAARRIFDGGGDVLDLSVPETEEERAVRIDATLARHSEKLDAIRAEVASLRRKWRSDFWKLLLLVVGGWLAFHFDLVAKLEPFWEGVKSDVEAFFAEQRGEDVAPAEAAGAKSDAAGQTTPANDAPESSAPPAEEGASSDEETPKLERSETDGRAL